jgi:putative tryptophan/tyrosine transport system substrate-binding protein
MAADLVSRNVAVILVGGSISGVRAALSASRTIPIVFTTASDPVATGLVASLNRPGGNATGVTVIAVALGAKVGLLHEMIPRTTKIAYLANPNNSQTVEVESPGVHSAAHRLGLELIVLNAGTASEIESSSSMLPSRGLREYISVLMHSSLSNVSRLARYDVARSYRRCGWRSDELRPQADMYRQAGVYVGIRAGHQSQDRQSTSPEDPADATRARRRGDRVAGRCRLLAQLGRR